MGKELSVLGGDTTGLGVDVPTAGKSIEQIKIQAGSS